MPGGICYAESHGAVRTSRGHPRRTRHGADAAYTILAFMEQVPDHILIVDDDAELRDMLVTYLGQNDYAAQGVVDDVAMDHYLAHNTVQMVVLDLVPFEIREQAR